MADPAIRRESPADVRRITGSPVSGLMTTVTGSRSPGKCLPVATDAVKLSMSTLQFKGGWMFEACVLPAQCGRSMTRLTIRLKAGADVIGVLCRQVGIDVTRFTGFRRTVIFLLLLPHMTGIAIGKGVEALQGESACRMDLEYVLSILPILWRVAALTFKAQLSFMEICMTIGAFHTNMRKLKGFVTTGAFHGLM